MIVHSPMPRGNGACVVHESLARGIAGYRLAPFDPRLTLFPPLLRCVERPPADLVHTIPDYAVCLAPASTPLVVTFHNYVLDDEMRGSSGVLRHLHNTTLLRYLTRAALARARAITCVSRFTADLVRRDLGWQGPIRVIHNGIDTDAFHPAPRRAGEERVRVLYCGNLTARKGVLLLPEILDALAPEVEFLYAAGLRTGRAAIHHPRATSAGSVAHADMPALYQSADILLFPTLREGFGLVVAEAMACGLPVVVSDCASLPELVTPEGGFLCRPGAAAEFAARINQLVADPRLRQRMGEFNRARAVALFGRERMLAGYRSLFEEVLASPA